MLPEFSITTLLLIALAQGVFLGVFAPDLARTSGPRSVKTTSIVVSVLSFVAGVILSTKSQALIGACAFVAPTFLISLWQSRRIARNIREDLEQAPLAVSFALSRFDRLAATDGITLASLGEALADKSQYPESELVLIRYLEKNICQIGHVYDTVILPGTSMGGVATVPMYAISRQDLQGYVQRLSVWNANWIN